MLRIKADVNGRVIGNLFIHNKSKRKGPDVWLYDAATYDPITDDGILGIEDVPHIRTRPWYELVEAVSRRIE